MGWKWTRQRHTAEDRVFDPLGADHPAVGIPCGICGEPLEVEALTILVPVRQTARAATVEATICHAECVLIAQDRLGAPFGGGHYEIEEVEDANS